MDNNDKSSFGIRCNNNILLKQLKTEIVDVDALSSMLNSQDSAALNRPILSGTILGPYSVREANEGDPEELKFMINNKDGKVNIFVPMNLDAFNLKRISSALSEESANCRIIFGDQKMFIIVSKTVMGWRELNAIYVPFDQLKMNNLKVQDIAGKPNAQSSLSPATLASHNELNEALVQINKKFVCSKCSISFTNAGKLKLHQNFYCKETSPINSDSPNAAAVALNFESTMKNAINSEGASAPNFLSTTNLTENSTLSDLLTCQLGSNFVAPNDTQKLHNLNALSRSFLMAAIEAATPLQSNPLPASNVLNENSQAICSRTTTPSNIAPVGASTNSLSTTESTVNLQQKSTAYDLGKDVASLANSNAPILLPVAYHSHDEPSLVQLVGSAQTIVPVAIHRNMPVDAVIFRPLLIDGSQASSLHLPSQNVNVHFSKINGEAHSSLDNFSLPLSFTQSPQVKPANSSDTATTTTKRPSSNDAAPYLPSSSSTFFSDLFAQLKSNLQLNNQYVSAGNLENSGQSREDLTTQRIPSPCCSTVAGTSIANNGLSFSETVDEDKSSDSPEKGYDYPLASSLATFTAKTAKRRNSADALTRDAEIGPLDLSTNGTVHKEFSQLGLLADLSRTQFLPITRPRAHTEEIYPTSTKHDEFLSLLAARKRRLPNISECSMESNKSRSRANSNGSIPLPDLSASNPASKNVSTAASPKRQRLMCDCGVSFSVEETLQGHKMYYCRNRVVSAEEKVVPAKSPLQCQLCDFRPSTHSQLSQHTRSVHTQIQSYVCTLCGYKGYSQRGIKSHLRVSHDREFQQYQLANSNNNNVNLTNLVFYVTSSPEAKEKFSCLKCLRNFLTHELFYRHDCYAGLHESNREHIIT